MISVEEAPTVHGQIMAVGPCGRRLDGPRSARGSTAFVGNLPPKVPIFVNGHGTRRLPDGGSRVAPSLLDRQP